MGFAPYDGREGKFMLDYYFTFRSMTAAQQAVMELKKSGLFASLLRAPRALSSMGCGYAVRVAFQNGSAAALVLRHTAADFTKIFQSDTSGGWREVFF